MYYYQHKYPNNNDLVIVEINTITDSGVYVSLVEYDNTEGMISINELTNRRYRSSHKIVQVGKTDVCRVIGVDQEKGYIDLSKKSVSADEVIKCREKWSKTKSVYTIMYDLSISRSSSLSDLYEEVVWPLEKKYGNTYKAFLDFISDPNSVPEIDQNDLIDILKKRFRSKLSKIRTVVDLTCFQYEGIDAIKDTFKYLKDIPSFSDISIDFIIPSFSLTITRPDKENGIQLLNQACEVLSKKIKEFGGYMEIKIYPRDIQHQDVEDVEDVENNED